MKSEFSGQLNQYVQQAGLSLRQMSSLSGIPHQTIFNWIKGSQPRWHPSLYDDLERLGTALGLSPEDFSQLLRLTDCPSKYPGGWMEEETNMEAGYRIPKGWFITGDAIEGYEIGVDPETTYEGQPCVTIKAGPDAVEFAALAQQIKAEAYHGKRLRFSAVLRTEEIINRSALFMRIGGPNGKMLAFDNMKDRYISGTTDWANHAVVLDVAADADNIVFGFLSSLAGQVWMSDVKMVTVDRSVPTTDLLEEIAPFFPSNLDFQE